METRDLLLQSMINLMEENHLDDITIKEITFGANVSRRTFYSHFSSKEDAVQFYLSSLNNTLLERTGQYKAINKEILSKLIFESWYENFRFNKILFNDPSYDTMDMFKNFLFFLSSHFESPILKENINQQEYVSSFVVGGLFHMIKKWLNSDNPESPDQMAQLFFDITGNITNNTSG